MDLSEVMSAVARGLDSSPPPSASKPIDKAAAFYNDLCVYIAERGKERVKSPIVDGCLRASQLHKVFDLLPTIAKFTHRSQFDQLFSGMPLVGEQMTYDAGHSIHAWWRGEYIGPWGRLWGLWRCVACGREAKGTLKSALRGDCPVGSGRPCWPEFVELFVECKKRRYRGHTDGLLVEPPAFEVPSTVLEIKSASTSSYDKLDEPDPEHMTQVHTYMHGLGVKEVMFVYVDKGKQVQWKWKEGRLRPEGNPRFKVFHRTFDEKRWAEIEGKLAEFWSIYDRLEAA